MYRNSKFNIVDQQRLFMKIGTAGAILNLMALHTFVSCLVRFFSPDYNKIRYRTFPHTKKMYSVVENFMKIGTVGAILHLMALHTFVSCLLHFFPPDYNKVRYRTFPHTKKCTH